MDYPVDDAALALNYRVDDPGAFAAHYRRDAGQIEIDPGKPSEAPDGEP